MKKNYLIFGSVVLGTLLSLNSCQSTNGIGFKKDGTQKNINLANRISSPAVENFKGNQYDAMFDLGDSPEQIQLRKNYLLSISKPSENIYRYLADRKERKAKGIRLAGERSGIEEMADYRRAITMPIGTNKMLYQDGFLSKEYSKALSSPILLAAKSEKLTSKSVGYSLSNVVWTERGPNNIPGRNRSIVASPNDPDKWYVGSAGGGVWISDNAGENWRTTTDFTVPNLATSTVAISESDSKIVYAGTGEPFGNMDAITGSGLIKSIDGGETWEKLDNTIDFGSVGRLLVNPNDANHLVVGTSKGIYLTKDGGAKWTQVYSGTQVATGGNAANKTYSNVQDLKSSKDFSTLYASVNTYGVMKSTDGGTTWTLIFDAIAKNKSIARIELAVAPSDNNRVFLSSQAGSTVGFYYSDDAGATFTELTHDSGDSKEIHGDQGWYDNVAAFNPLDKNVVYVGGVYLAKITIDPTTNKYKVLQVASGYNKGKLNLYVHPDQHGLMSQVSSTDSTKFRLVLNNDGGVYYTDYKTNPGETEGDWIGPVKDLNSTQFYGADKKKGEDAYVGGAQDNGSNATITAPATKSSEYLQMWGGDGFEAIWNYNDPKKILVGSQFNNFVVFKAGVQKTQLYWAKNSDGGNSAVSPFYSKLANANNNPDVVFTVSKNGVWRSPDFGSTWSLTSFNSTANGTWLGHSSSASIKVSVADPKVVWAVAAAGTSPNYKVNVSKDNGQTFTKTTGVMPIGGTYYVSGLAASAVKPSRAFVTFSVAGKPKIVKTDDFGDNWTDITGFSSSTSTAGFPDVPVHSVLEMPFDEKVIWAGTDIGLFETVDGGASWYLITAIPPVSIWGMKIVDDQVILATHGRGIWTATIPELRNVQMPEYIIPPNVTSVIQNGIHDMAAKASFTYTNPKINSLKVYVDNNYVSTISSTVPNTTYNYITSALAEGSHTISVSGVYDNTEETLKSTKSFEVIKFNTGTANVNIPTFTTNDVYIGKNGKFVIDNVASKFSYNVLNNIGHPYENSTNYQTYLRTPIIVDSDSKMTINHMALTESNYDFAIVEASKDLVNWTEVGKYDEKKFSAWRNVKAADVKETLFQNSDLDFTKNFDKGDEVAVRLRLISDEAETRYGWLIKSIIPTANLGTDEVSIAKSEEATIAPNPAVEETTLYLPSTVKGKLTIAIFDASGRSVRTLTKNASTKVDMNISDLEKGVYLVLVKGENFNKALKLIKK